jgi:hypothetical protein
MKTVHGLFMALAILALTSLALADVPPIPPTPKPAPDEGPHLSIIVDPAAKTSSVTLPSAAAGKAAAATDQGTSAFARAQTIIIGGALTLAIALGGLWLIRGRGRGRAATGTAALIILGAGVMGTAVTAALADIGPGPRPRPPAPGPLIPVTPVKPDAAKTVLDGAPITIEQGDGKDIILHLTSADAAKLWAGLRPAAAKKDQ